MSLFETPPPALSNDALAALAQRLYGLSGTLTPLASERDQNVRLETQAGAFVLKIAHPAEDRAFLDMQNKVLAHLASLDVAGIPHLIPSLAGEAMTETVLPDGRTAAVRLVSYIEGELFSKTSRTIAQLSTLGRFLGTISKGLAGFGHPAAHKQDFLWSLDNAAACATFIPDIADPDRRALIENLLAHYTSNVAPRLPALRGAVLHQDANDNNLIMGPNGSIAGLIDFGDMGYGRQINELAIAMAYALLDAPDLYAGMRAMVSGYAEVFPITEDEAELVFDLMRIRLAMSVSISSHQSRRFPDNAYLLISQEPAFALLEKLDAVSAGFCRALCRKAAGFSATRATPAVTKALSTGTLAPVFTPDLADRPRMVLSLDGRVPSMPPFSNKAFDTWFAAQKQDQPDLFGIGLYGEKRSVYATDAFSDAAGPERRTRHLGIDIFLDAGTPIHAPLAGTVHTIANNAYDLDYGHTLILEHRIEDGTPFFSLYGHLGASLPALLSEGQTVEAGQLIGHLGDWSENGNWAPHLHIQFITDLLEETGNFFGVGHDSHFDVWADISPDANLLLGLLPESFAIDANPPEKLLTERTKRIGPSLSISYAKKLKIVRGRGTYLFDHTGRRYLDCVNNITHVGHAHPQVVSALAAQAAVLNTNTRYLHDLMPRFAERLTEKLPGDLSVVYFTNSGTEANELALRIARTANGQKDTIVLDWAYHGNSGGMVDVSPYKFQRKGGYPKPEFTEITQFPDPYRGPFKGYGIEAGKAYAADITRCLDAIVERTGNPKAAFIAESISGVGGQVFYPDGYLKAAYEAVRDRDGVVIADEVQCGFGRVGSHFWGFETQGVIPDIVVLGKPIGNGHPLGAVITTPELAARFANGMEYFNSFGGNPVSMAVGLAVLDVIEAEDLQASALETGRYLLNRLAELASRYDLIGDVRGKGLFSGVELVRDRTSLEPATEQAGFIVNHMREHGVLASTDGPLDNVLKFKPPMVFGKPEADRLVAALDAALTALN